MLHRRIEVFAAAREPLEAERVAVLAEVAGRHPTGTERLRLRDLTNAIADIDDGMLKVNSLGALYTAAGLLHVQRQVGELQTERDQWAGKIGMDPDELVPCRLRRLVSHYYNGRRVKLGEEVVLTRSQLEAFADRFEAVV
ncbi:MAG TPA: hypothetical protein VNJ02_12995 [Vicinamibacterales bacterium]|nr:hypothetical protein [Vicinamibacterales bacterium]